MMSPFRATAAALGSAVLLVSLAGPALAVKPVRDCPAGGPFEPITRAEALVLATTLFGAEAAPARTEQLFGQYDKNGDAVLCAQEKTGKGRDHDRTVYNFTDNTAR